MGPSTDCSDTEKQKSTHAPAGLSPAARYWKGSLRVDFFLEIQLILLTVSTGIQDAITFPDFHGFASNQTGNTVLLAVGLARHIQDLFDLTNIGLSLASFIAGAVFTGQLGNVVGPRRRAWHFAINMVQSLMVFGAAIIQFQHGVQESGPWPQFALGLLAGASGSQVASARSFKLNEITTAMATAAWVDLVIDPELLSRRNRPRNRRAVFLVALVAGSFAGAFMQARIGSALALIISGIGKLLVTAATLIAKSDRDDEVVTETVRE